MKLAIPGCSWLVLIDFISFYSRNIANSVSFCSLFIKAPSTQPPFLSLLKLSHLLTVSDCTLIHHLSLFFCWLQLFQIILFDLRGKPETTSKDEPDPPDSK